MSEDPFKPDRNMPDLLRMRKVEYEKVEVKESPTLADLEAAVLTKKAGDDELMKKFIDMLISAKK